MVKIDDHLIQNPAYSATHNIYDFTRRFIAISVKRLFKILGNSSEFPNILKCSAGCALRYVIKSFL